MAATVVVGVLGLGAAHESVDGAHEASPRAEHVPVVHPRDVAATSPLARAPTATAPVPEPAVVVDARVEPRAAVSAAPDVARAQPREPDAAATEQSQSVPDEVPSGAGALAQESALLRQARMLQGRGDFEAALERLDAHARRFSRGQLADGRDRLRIRVLCDLGQTTRARREAQQLARTRPDDPLAQQALSICAAP